MTRGVNLHRILLNSKLSRKELTRQGEEPKLHCLNDEDLEGWTGLVMNGSACIVTQWGYRDSPKDNNHQHLKWSLNRVKDMAPKLSIQGYYSFG